jgi:hypothetical protein
MLEISNFIGYPENARFEYFHGHKDSKQTYDNNLKVMGPDWEYAKMFLTYKRNSLGHRSKEFSELNLDNYILCTGCSISEGIGLPVNKRYSDVLAYMLNCDMYNLGLGGSGNDVIFYNLVTWFTSVPIKPKLVVIGWTSENRFLVDHDDQISLSTASDLEVEDFLLAGDELNYFASKTSLMKKLIRKIITVPIIEIPWHADATLEKPIHAVHYGQNKIVDLARDLTHPGIKSNQIIAETIYEYINTNVLLDK